MTITRFIVAICALQMTLAPFAVAKTKSVPTRVVAVQEVTLGDSFILRGKHGSILRQDLFDRLNRNNIRTDWPAPPAQPGQF
jgi:hypothetical protein